MPNFDTVIRGGRLATASEVFDADLGIIDGKIAAVGRSLGAGATEIDAAGRLVLPGGVDGHCHLDQPTSDGSEMADDFFTGTRSAVFGGTTTVIPFACQFRGQSMRDVVADYHARAAGKAVVDYAFHLIVSDPTPQLVGQDLPALVRDGYTSFKIYMTYEDMKLDDRQILDLLTVARTEGAMTMIHAENADFIGWLTERLIGAGKTAPRHHAEARPMLVEREATHRAISMAELADTPILIVHVSGREAVEQIHWAKGRGLKIFAETCPQYLVLSDRDLARPGFEGAKCICSPPPRDPANQEAIWNGLISETLDIVSSDHAPFRYASPKGKMLCGDPTAFNWVPNGIPGIETRLPILFSEGVVKGRIDLPRFVALTATNPAKMYGLHPRKGSLAVGADADVVIWDPERRVTIRNEALHHDVDYTPYEGLEITGWPETVLSRGEVVVDRGRFAATAGRGQFLPCDTPAAARPKYDANRETLRCPT